MVPKILRSLASLPSSLPFHSVLMLVLNVYLGFLFVLIESNKEKMPTPSSWEQKSPLNFDSEKHRCLGIVEMR